MNLGGHRFLHEWLVGISVLKCGFSVGELHQLVLVNWFLEDLLLFDRWGSDVCRDFWLSLILIILVSKTLCQTFHLVVIHQLPNIR